MGYPRAVLVERERVVVNLLLEAGVSDSTRQALRALHAPLFVVARRTPPPDLSVASLPALRIDPIAKLDALPAGFEPVMRSPTLALYRYRPEFGIESGRPAGERSMGSDPARPSDSAPGRDGPNPR